MSARLPSALEAEIYSSLGSPSSEQLEEACGAVLENVNDPLALHVGLDADFLKITQAAVSLRNEVSAMVQKHGSQAALQWLSERFSVVVKGHSDDPALLCPQISDVRVPNLVGCLRAKLAIQDVLRHG